MATAKKTSRSGTRPAAAVAAGGAAEADLSVSGWEYAPAPEARDVVSISGEYGLFIGGEFVPAADRRQLTTINPATEEPLARVAQAGP
ncbi:MAG: hypothetical protein M3Y33_14720, partial [Actinomycetota bacterium]|nr:hypothetical protein [Actinomycetota bacterium]